MAKAKKTKKAQPKKPRRKAPTLPRGAQDRSPGFPWGQTNHDGAAVLGWDDTDVPRVFNTHLNHHLETREKWEDDDDQPAERLVHRPVRELRALLELAQHYVDTMVVMQRALRSSATGLRVMMVVDEMEIVVGVASGTERVSYVGAVEHQANFNHERHGWSLEVSLGTIAMQRMLDCLRRAIDHYDGFQEQGVHHLRLNIGIHTDTTQVTFNWVNGGGSKKG